jgi:hypothetical protein
MPIPTHILKKYFFRVVQPGLVDECWLWPENSLNNKGYGQLTLRLRRLGYPKRKVRLLAHRVSYTLHVGMIGKGLQIMHECDTRRCVNPAHLTPGTQKTNEAGKVARGRSARGQRQWAATLSDSQAQEILDRYRAGELPANLAIEFSVSLFTAVSICTRTRWKFLR